MTVLADVSQVLAHCVRHFFEDPHFKGCLFVVGLLLFFIGHIQFDFGIKSFILVDHKYLDGLNILHTKITQMAGTELVGQTV